MCCLFGLIDYGNMLTIRNKEKIIKVLSKECEARGTDATGVAYMTGNKMTIYKKALPAGKMKFKFNSNPSVIMGHTRMTTKGSEKNNINNHPFYSAKLGFALAHNGVLYNDKTIRKTEKLPKTKIETDSYVAVQLIEKHKTLNFDTIKNMAEKVEGSFCFTILDKEKNLYIIKGDNPMCIVRFNGFYIYASTKEILTKALKKLGLKYYKEINIKTGEILKINILGNIIRHEFDMDFGYSYWNNYCWGYSSRSKDIANEAKSVYDEYLNDLIYYGKSVGFDEETILELLDLGYDYMDIEDMIYNFDYYREDNFCGEI
ncbi:MAG: hypothetical protein Q4D26_06870 [Clostridia bacterium]|nr:hypothetical protein [Clostridia bacterium]